MTDREVSKIIRDCKCLGKSWIDIVKMFPSLNTKEMERIYLKDKK